MNRHKMFPALRQGSTPSMLKLCLRNVQDGWANEWHVRPVAKVRVQSAKGGAKTSKLHVCLWDPSSVFHERAGSAHGGDLTQGWSRQKVGMTLQGTRWRYAPGPHPLSAQEWASGEVGITKGKTGRLLVRPRFECLEGAA